MNADNDKPFDLEERTAVFGEKVIDFAKEVPKNEITRPLISQIVRSGTSVGANYVEADDAVSNKEFHLQKGSPRDQTLVSHDRPCCSADAR